MMSLRSASTKQNPHHSVWVIAIIGLTTGALILGTVSWSLFHIKNDRIQGDFIHARAAAAIGQADEIFSMAQAQSAKLLDEDLGIEPEGYREWSTPFTQSEIEHLFDHQSQDAIRESSVSVSHALDRLIKLNEECLTYRTRLTSVVSTAQSAKENVDCLLRQLTIALDRSQGQELLDFAIRVRDHRQATGARRDALANEFLESWSPNALGNAVKIELAELAVLCEKLFVEKSADSMSDYRENRIRPILDRISALIGTRDSAKNREKRNLLSQLDDALFRAPVRGVEEQPRDELPLCGLLECCRTLLQLRDKKDSYELRLKRCSKEFNVSRNEFLGTLDRISRDSSEKAASLVARAWFSVAIVGLVLSLILLYFAKRASLLIQNQFLSIQETSAALALKTDELSASSEYLSLLSLVAKHTDNLVLITSDLLDVIWVNDGFLRITGFDLDEVKGQYALRFLEGDATDRKVFKRIQDSFGDEKGFDIETVQYRKDGTPFWVSIEARPILAESGKTSRYVIMSRDISERVAAEKEQQRLNALLCDASRAAGVADVATEILHNVGNVLNSVNVSASIIQDMNRHSVFTNLERVCGLIEEHIHDFGDYVSMDQQGQQLPEFLLMITKGIKKEREGCLAELSELVSNVDHIKSIVSVQQEMAESGGVLHRLSATELCEDAITATKGRLTNHGVGIVKTIPADLPLITSDKHKILQVLINLISNAKDSLVESKSTRPTIHVSVAAEKQGLCFSISDNGVGISPDKIDMIFQHGFTTKKTGHGFGLHSSANAATGIGGSLTVESDGAGLGATFRLFVPFVRNQTEQPAASST